MSERAEKTYKPSSGVHHNNVVDHDRNTNNQNNLFIQPKEGGDYFFSPRNSKTETNGVKTGLFGEPAFFQPNPSRQLSQKGNNGGIQSKSDQRIDLKRNSDPNRSKSRNEAVQRITKVTNSANTIQPFLGMGAGLGLASYIQMKKFKKMQAKLKSVRGRINFLRMRSGLNNMLSGGNGQIRFTNAQWARLQKKVAKSTSIVSRASSYSMLGFANTIPSALTTFLSSGMAVGGSVMVAPAALEGLLGSLAGAASIGIGIALAEVLALIALIALIIYILYLIVVVIIEIVDTIAEAIERLRKVAPILWPLTLPMRLPLKLGYIMPRTYTTGLRLKNGGQAKVRAYLNKQGIKGKDAHHIQPLFLGGLDTRSNVVAWDHYLHMAGHASLATQPQLLALGLKPNLYSHHPPMQFFIAGRKP